MADKLHSRLQGRAGWNESKINAEGEEEMFKKIFLFFFPPCTAVQLRATWSTCYRILTAWISSGSNGCEYCQSAICGKWMSSGSRLHSPSSCINNRAQSTFNVLVSVWFRHADQPNVSEFKTSWRHLLLRIFLPPSFFLQFSISSVLSKNECEAFLCNTHGEKVFWLPKY